MNVIQTINKSLSVKIMLAVLAVFITVVTVATYISHVEEKDRVLEMIKQQVSAQNNAAFDSLNMLIASIC